MWYFMEMESCRATLFVDLMAYCLFQYLKIGQKSLGKFLRDMGFKVHSDLYPTLVDINNFYATLGAQLNWF